MQSIYFVKSLECPQWVSPPQEDSELQTWTKLIADGYELSNSLEQMYWHDGVLMPIACELCWDCGCSIAGYSHLWRTANHVVWRVLSTDEHEDVVETSASGTAWAIERSHWQEKSQRHECLPKFEDLELPSRSEILQTWRNSCRLAGKPYSEQSYVDFIEQFECICSDPDNNKIAAIVVREWELWAGESPDSPVNCDLKLVTDEAELQTLVFDFPEETVTWHPYVANSKSLVIGNASAIEIVRS